MILSLRFALEEKAAFVAQCSEEESNRIVEETLAEEVAAVAQEILNNELRRIRKFIKRFVDLFVFEKSVKICLKWEQQRICGSCERFVGLVTTLHLYSRWCNVVAVRRKLKRQMRGFPAAPGCVDPRFKLQALVPSAPASACPDHLVQGMVNMGNSGNMSVSCTRWAYSSISVHFSCFSAFWDTKINFCYYSLLKMRQEAVHQMKVSYYYNLLLR